MANRQLRVCYFGTYRAEYSRNQILIEGLRRNGVDVVECHEPLWGSFDDRVRVATGGWADLAFGWRLLKAYGRLLRRYFSQTQDYDVLMVGYPGQLDVYLAWLLSRIRRRPLVWDTFMSIYLIMAERGLAARARLSARLLRGLEALACRLPDLMFLETPEYVAWFQETHGVAPDRFGYVLLGADDRVLKPLGPEPTDGPFVVVYYGTYIPTHGVEHIVEAARLIGNDRGIAFEFFGRGPDKDRACALAEQYGLANVTFVDWLDQPALMRRVARAHVCLGTFGNTPQALFTIQNKVYEGLAIARPVITGDSPAARASLAHEENVYLVERCNPAAIAEAIRVLRADGALRQRISQAGYRLFQERFTVKAIGARAKAYLEQLLAQHRSAKPKARHEGIDGSPG